MSAVPFSQRDLSPAARAALGDLYRIYPDLFAGRGKPLARDIASQLVATWGALIDTEPLQDALRHHVMQPRYLRCLSGSGARRHNLDLSDAGHVSADEADQAAALLRAIRAHDRVTWHKRERDRLRFRARLGQISPPA